MQKKHQINIITAQPNQDGWRADTTKTFKLGMKSKSYFNTWWKQNIIEWDSLSELSKILEPYILGTHPDSRYSALMYGQFREGTEDIYGTRRKNEMREEKFRPGGAPRAGAGGRSRAARRIALISFRLWAIQPYAHLLFVGAPSHAYQVTGCSV